MWTFTVLVFLPLSQMAGASKAPLMRSHALQVQPDGVVAQSSRPTLLETAESEAVAVPQPTDQDVVTQTPEPDKHTADRFETTSRTTRGPTTRSPTAGTAAPVARRPALLETAESEAVAVPQPSDQEVVTQTPEPDKNTADRFETSSRTTRGPTTRSPTAGTAAPVARRSALLETSESEAVAARASYQVPQPTDQDVVTQTPEPDKNTADRFETSSRTTRGPTTRSPTAGTAAPVARRSALLETSESEAVAAGASDQVLADSVVAQHSRWGWLEALRSIVLGAGASDQAPGSEPNRTNSFPHLGGSGDVRRTTSSTTSAPATTRQPQNRSAVQGVTPANRRSSGALFAASDNVVLGSGALDEEHTDIEDTDNLREK